MLRLKKRISSPTSSDAASNIPTITLDESKGFLITASPILSCASDDLVYDDLSLKTGTHDDDDLRWKRKISISSLESDNEESSTQKKMKVRVDEEVPSGSHSFPSSGQRLLSLACDTDHLNPLHCFVRRNIQLFLASLSDIHAPAPGRKKDIFLNQIGIRCIHCMHTPTQDRVKRAVCYPSGISRIYHCVSDMKIDHFTQCPKMPPEATQEFLALKQKCCKNKRKNSVPVGNKKPINVIGAASTARYYVESAKALGIVQNQNGLFLWNSKKPEYIAKLVVSSSSAYKPVSPSLSSISSTASSDISESNILERDPKEQSSTTINAFFSQKNDAFSPTKFTGAAAQHLDSTSHHPQESFSVPSKYIQKPGCVFVNCTLAMPPPEFVIDKPQIDQAVINSYFELQLSSSNIRSHEYTHSVAPLTSSVDLKRYCAEAADQETGNGTSIKATRRLLAMPGDSLVLNELHCFVRKNIEVFSSTKNDVSIPAPGRKSRVTIAQVGMRCIHCCDLPYKDRVKRAVCYPPTVGGIYHCVSNMKFDHFEACRGLPEELKAQLLELKVSCNRKGGSQTANCTARYYVDAAEKLGLVDTSDGIRFYTGSGNSAENCQELSVGVLHDVRNQQDWGINSNGLDVLVLAVNQAKRAQCDAEHHTISQSFSPRKISVDMGESRVFLPST